MSEQQQPSKPNHPTTNKTTSSHEQNVPPPTQKPLTKNSKTPPTTEPTPTKTNRSSKFHFSKPLTYYLPWATGLLFATWITQIAIIYIVGNTLKKQITTSAIIQQQISDQQRANQATTEYQEKINKLAESFPEEKEVILFVRNLNTQIKQFSDPELKFSHNEPIQIPELISPFLPVSLSVVATPSAFIPFMQKLAQNKYLFQPVLLEINNSKGINDSSQITYKSNFFVSKKLVE